MNNRTLTLFCAMIAVLLIVQPSSAVLLGQLDDFQDGTTMGWTAGGGPNGGMPLFPPANADGGPAGGGDLFLQLTSTGGPGAGGKMVALNPAQWSGDYLSAGITGLQMDVNNQSGLPLELRVRFEHFSMPGPPTGDFLSGQSVSLAPQSGWQTVFFPISSADLVDLTSGLGDDYATTLGDVGVIRLLHDTDTTLPPPTIDAMLGVDNITAVPEPGVPWVLWLVALCAWRRAA